MNILFLEQHPRFGGWSERMSFALCGHALAKGHRAWLAYQLAGDMVDAYRAAGATCVQLPITPIAVRKPLAAVRAVGALRRLVRRAGIDVIFTSQVGYASLLAIVGRMTGVQTAVHLGLVYDFPSPIFRTAIRHLTLGVAPSVHTAEGWKERGWPGASLIVIPNGVDTARFTPGDGRMAARERLGLSGARGPLIAYVGRLTRVKGILTLARAFAAYRRAGGEGTLIYVGASLGDDEAVLRSLAQAEGLTEPMWAVRPATAKPEDVYRAADLVVVPSEWDEPFGLVPL
jgi:glycosyltransferase involved in cell wall biosynthesis